MHIAIAGNIGSGKTTLTTKLAKHYKWEAHYEDVENNPYLNDFYKDMQRWSFNLQVFFLNSRFRQIVNIKDSGKTYIQDRTIFEDAKIFAPNLHQMGLMSSRDFDNYMEIFNLMDGFIEGPDLLIYLRASVPKLVEQIQKRGRDYENSIRLDYLTRLNERYEAWIGEYAKGSPIILAVETLNRFESHFLNTAEDAVAFVDAVGLENCKVHLDTFHMLREESDIGEDILATGKEKLAYFHACGSHRGIAGRDLVPWAQTFQALKDINYEYCIGVESFNSNLEQLY